MLEGVESAVLSGVGGPCLATIEYRAKHAGLIHLYLGADDQYGVTWVSQLQRSLQI